MLLIFCRFRNHMKGMEMIATKAKAPPIPPAMVPMSSLVAGLGSEQPFLNVEGLSHWWQMVG